MLTAHRTLGDTPGTYGLGWDILDDDTAVWHVRTRAEAESIVQRQRLPITDQRLATLSARMDEGGVYFLGVPHPISRIKDVRLFRVRSVSAEGVATGFFVDDRDSTDIKRPLSDAEVTALFSQFTDYWKEKERSAAEGGSGLRTGRPR